MKGSHAKSSISWTGRERARGSRWDDATNKLFARKRMRKLAFKGAVDAGEREAGVAQLEDDVGAAEQGG